LLVSQLERITKAELIKRIRALESQLGDGCDADSIAADAHQHTDGANNQRSREPQEALQHYAHLYDFAPIAYMALDQDGRIAEINMTGATMLGWKRSWLLGQPFDR
jgi:hypothetical protein